MLTLARPQMIGRAIESLRSQSLASWELIIVRDGDHRQTDEIVREWAAKEPRLRYLSRGKTGSIAEASNAGLLAARMKQRAAAFSAHRLAVVS